MAYYYIISGINFLNCLFLIILNKAKRQSTVTIDISLSSCFIKYYSTQLKDERKTVLVVKLDAGSNSNTHRT